MGIVILGLVFLTLLFFEEKKNSSSNSSGKSSGGFLSMILNFNSSKDDIISKAVETANSFGIPPSLFLALINQESGFNPKAVSSTGAYGLTQLEPGTANEVGVGDSVYTSPDNQLYGGAKYLKQQFDLFGSWDLALAAYNAGAGNVETYKGIPPFAETQNYVKSILAQQENYAGYN